MGRGHDLQTLCQKLQRPRGYQGCRIRPDLEQRNKRWFAEIYTQDQAGTRKRWKPLLDEQTQETQSFASPELAEQALIEARREPFTDNRPFYIRLAVGIPEEQHWRTLISHAEQEAPGSLEAMIEDASTRLVAAMRELRTCQNQRRANKLYEIAIGQSNRLSHLARFTHEETTRLQWLKIDQ